ncbi:hypothetical protein LSH36_372g04029 [Paralvinella palmiformis]|uniref:Uncharacterized protein n=1 Tax=Paralvinella palmiformis TaxID=53620 RepID=A0AAD9JE36_9ANNE|nr:hypothetical protein LSH36_372g04029 [Paralvinella palmiformis]
MNKSRASSISATSQIAFAQPPLIQEVDIDRVEVKQRRCALEDLIKYKELAERGDATKYWTSVFALKLPGVDANDIAADRKYDDISANHGKMHDADVAVEPANRNASFDSRIGVDWLKMNNAGSRCEHVTGSRGSVEDPDDMKLQS